MGKITEPAPESKGASELDELRARLSRTREELSVAQAKLIRAKKHETLSQIAAGIAHEMNTPAQYVNDNVTFLQRAFDKLLRLIEAQSSVIEAARSGHSTALPLEAADAARRDVKLDYLARHVPRAIEQSQQGLEQISAILKAMKEFAHPSGAEKQPCDLHDLIECVTVVVRSEWRYVADVDLDFDWSLPPVPLVRNQLAEALLQLLVNAAQAINLHLPQAATRKGRIVISTKLLEQRAQILISDNGGGISEARKSEVFAGGGLSTARAIVESHGGSLEFETSAGAGTTFALSLPLGSA